MSTKNKAPHGQPWKVDELGIVTWAKGTDPMIEVEEAMQQMLGGPKHACQAVDQVHKMMSYARSVALSLFGSDWPEYVLQVYDRIRDVQDDLDEERLSNMTMTTEIEMRCVARCNASGEWFLHIEGLKDILRHAEAGIEKSSSGGAIGPSISVLHIRLFGRIDGATYPLPESTS